VNIKSVFFQKKKAFVLTIQDIDDILEN